MSESLEKQNTQISNDINLDYWVGRWENNKIGFHRSDVNM